MKEPKEKAREVVFKFYDVFANISDIPIGAAGVLRWSKRCALIAIDEIIDFEDEITNYWKQVKEEINKL